MSFPHPFRLFIVGFIVFGEINTILFVVFFFLNKLKFCAANRFTDKLWSLH